MSFTCQNCINLLMIITLLSLTCPNFILYCVIDLDTSVLYMPKLCTVVNDIDTFVTYEAQTL